MKQNPYAEMPSFMKMEHLAKLIHCLQNNVTLFEASQEIIALGQELGVFKGVKIGLELTTVENAEI